MNLYSPASPGEILTEYLSDYTPAEAAKKLELSDAELTNLLNGLVEITPDIAKKLGNAFDASEQYWLNLNNQYESWKSNQQKV